MKASKCPVGNDFAGVAARDLQTRTVHPHGWGGRINPNDQEARMRGYGRDYNDRNWMDRAGETVRGWFGGGRDYDREYGPGNLREWKHGSGHHGTMGGGMGGQMQGGYRQNNWNNMRSNYDRVYRAGGYYNADYDAAGGRGSWGAGQGGYDRDFGGGGHWRPVRTIRPGNPGYGGGMGGGMGRGQQGGGMQGGNMGRDWMQNEYGGGGYNAGNDWGDYNRGGWGGDLFRNSRSGGVEPGRHFRGYGHGSSGGNGYEPF